jgi:hypothetical protein
MIESDGRERWLMINEYAYETTTAWDSPVGAALTYRGLRMVPSGLPAAGGITCRARLCARWLDLGLELAEFSHGAAFSGGCHARSADGPDLGPRRLGDNAPWGRFLGTVAQASSSRAPSQRLVILEKSGRLAYWCEPHGQVVH